MTVSLTYSSVIGVPVSAATATSRLVIRWQLIGFVLVAVMGLVYVGANYVRLDNLLGFGEYTVNLELETSGGIFTNAEIAYRGVPVGRVGDMSLAADGVVVESRIDKSAPDIPASAKAVVANRSTRSHHRDGTRRGIRRKGSGTRAPRRSSRR